MSLSRPLIFALSLTAVVGGVFLVWYTCEVPAPADHAFHRPFAPPAPVGVCSVAPLTAVSDSSARAFETGENLAVDLSGLTPKTLAALTKFEDKVVAMGGTFTLTSAFRPVAYQLHLREVWFKWMDELRDNHDPACADLRADVQREFQRHGLLETQHPVEVSDHTKGTGFDAKVTVPEVVKFVGPKKGRKKKVVFGLDQIAKSFGLRRPNPTGDRVHFRCVS